MNKACILWTVVVSRCLLCSLAFSMNMTRYFMMPNLYNFDDYDRCFQELDVLSTYCFARAEVVPDPSSNVWLAILEISMYNKHHFDHRHLYYGFCVRWCEDTIRKLSIQELTGFNGKTLTNNSKVNTYLQLFSSEQLNRDQYGLLVQQCINLRLERDYGLKARSVVEYCTTNRTSVKQDYWNMSLFALLYLNITLVFSSSLYDYFMRRNWKNKSVSHLEYYTRSPRDLCDNLLVSYSITRNWYRFDHSSKQECGRNLRFLDCLKFFSMFLVIFAHTVWGLYEAGLENPQDPERMLHTLSGTLLISGSIITTTFFVISGFLLGLGWIEATNKTNESSWKQYAKLLIKFNAFRYIRLTVPYAVIILLSGYNYETPGGPLWRHIVQREQLCCRKNWWINVLYLNNHINCNERCILQSWYLAADTHSFLLSFLILIPANRWPRLANFLFGSTFAFFVVLPGALTYLNGYNPVYMPSPQTQRDSFINDHEFNSFYTPFYMNFGCYFSGVVTAHIYKFLAQNQFHISHYKIMHVIWFCLFPLGILWLFSAHPFFQSYSGEISLIWRSIYAALHRNVWAIGVCFLILGMAAKMGWILREFASLRIFRYLGRLTYGAFIIHVYVGKIVVAPLRQPIYLSTNVMFSFVLFTVVMSYLLSFILAVLVELPMTALLRLLR